ncbi:hypothetical protein [Nonomuraea pusilla]|uniref:GIY-YIG nuclease family protein n=1 Tax=Nonomuraea pusilla TaxID=46177 RepID=A0A1H8JEJ7_9ACTN|nr:hypothetical protein [Nonomuraea pusilla]SEN78855.1 hypothetical protein SAMN05660976_08319 [Nonomuraea pusilla]
MCAVRLAPAPLVVSLSCDLDNPIKIRAKHKVAGMLLLDRDYANRLERSWNVPGAYILLDRPDAEGRWGAYIGKATSPGLRQRVLQQLKGRDHWYRALLIRYESNDDERLNSSEAGWLEGRLYDHLAGAGQVNLHNRNRPQDPTLSDDEETSLIDYLLPVTSVLRLIGHNLHPRNPNAPDGGGPLVKMIKRGPAPAPGEPQPYVSVFGYGPNRYLLQDPTWEELQERIALINAGKNPLRVEKDSGKHP